MKSVTLPIYLDHNATTPLLPEVVEAMLPYLRQHFGNPSSGHVFGARAREALETARGQVAALLGAEPSEILFTSGGTEANNLAILGATACVPQRRHVVTSVVEHPATVNPCRLLERRGYQVTWLGVDHTCRIRPADLRHSVSSQTALVTLMHSNNETGSIQPLGEVASAVREAGALLHTDAAQSVGKVEIRVAELGVDLLSVAGHKLYAPKGVGALYVRAGVALEPVLRGAGHERGLRPGTENVPSIVGLGAACEVAAASLTREAERLRSLRDDLFSRLRDRIPEVALCGHQTERLPGTLNVRFPGVRGSALLTATPEVAASTGSACHEGGEAPSEVLLAMGIAPEDALGAVRLSLGRHTTNEEVRRAADLLVAAWKGLAS